jgi:type IV pilus assembly protein PilA
MHPGNKQTGFTLIETSIAVGIASILAAIAVPQYNIHIAKTQLAESISLMDAAKPGAAAAVVKQGQCTADGKDLTADGKYGALVVSGTVDPKAIKNSKVRMATGCIFTYTANTAGVSKLIAGKTVVADLFNNGTFSKSAATTADERLLPKALSLLDQDPAGSKITPTVPGGPNITNPGDNGGPSTPNTIPPVGPSNPDPSNPDPSNPDLAKPDLAAPSDPTSGDPSTPDKVGTEEPLPIGASDWVLSLKSKPLVLKFRVANFLWGQDFMGSGVYEYYDTDVKVNLGAAYANKAVTGTMVWQYTDDHHPLELSAYEVINISKTADANGIVKLDTFVSHATPYASNTGTKFELTLNSAGKNVYSGALAGYF